MLVLTNLVGVAGNEYVHAGVVVVVRRLCVIVVGNSIVCLIVWRCAAEADVSGAAAVVRWQRVQCCLAVQTRSYSARSAGLEYLPS